MGTRYDLAWAFPQSEFQLPGMPLCWWIDSSYSTEAQARHRMRELESFMHANFGSMALYRIDFNGRNILSERLVHRTGKAGAPPKRADVMAMNRGVDVAFRTMTGAWVATGHSDIVAIRSVEQPVIRTAVRRRKKGNGGVAALTAFICLFAVATGVVGLYAQQPAWRPGTAVVEIRAVDPARYDHALIAIPNREGNCDSMSFNNRTGSMTYAGKTDCPDTAPASTVKGASPTPAMAGISKFFRRQ